jgi:hypothetical protein
MWFVACQQGRESRKAAGGGIAANACIDNTVADLVWLQAFLQQVYPALFGLYAKGGAKAVAYYQYITRGLLGRVTGYTETGKDQAKQ